MEGVPDDYNFIRLGGRTYTIKEVAVPTVDAAVAVMQDVHRRRTEALTQQLRTSFVQEAFALANQEHTTILREADRSSISVPQNKYGIPLVVLGTELCPVRSHLYAPNTVSGSLLSWMRYLSPDNTGIWETIETVMGTPRATVREPSSHQIRITGHAGNYTSMLCAYSTSHDRLVLNKQTYHTTGRVFQSADAVLGWHKMCTGNTPPRDYWNMELQVFRNGLNSINLDSLATTTMMFEGRAVSVVNIVSCLGNKVITHVPPAEGWGEAS